MRLFHDDEEGGFFTTGHDAEALVVRTKDIFDNATPAAGSLAANGLLRLGALTGDTTGDEHALAILRMLARPLGGHPTSFAYLLGALERTLTPPIEIAIVGEPQDPRTARAPARGHPPPDPRRR